MRVTRALYPDILTRHLEIDIVYRNLKCCRDVPENEANRFREIFLILIHIIICLFFILNLFIGKFSEVDEPKIQKNPHLKPEFFQVRTSVSNLKIL